MASDTILPVSAMLWRLLVSSLTKRPAFSRLILARFSGVPAQRFEPMRIAAL